MYQLQNSLPDLLKVLSIPTILYSRHRAKTGFCICLQETITCLRYYIWRWTMTPNVLKQKESTQYLQFLFAHSVRGGSRRTRRVHSAGTVGTGPHPPCCPQSGPCSTKPRPQLTHPTMLLSPFCLSFLETTISFIILMLKVVLLGNWITIYMYMYVIIIELF